MTNENQNQSSSGAVRYDMGKVRVDLVSPIAILGVAAVLDFGAKKYAENNWRKGMPWSKVIGPLLRHALKFMMGEDIDYDSKCETCISKTCKNHSGLPHIDHIACNVMFLQEYYRTQKHLDDRFKIDLSNIDKLKDDVVTSVNKEK